ncbi:MAG: SpoIIE family protein phosphatase [Candidatus Acidiferrales bacterium]
MHETDRVALGSARKSEAINLDLTSRTEKLTMPEVSEPYIREQLAKRREELQATISAASTVVSTEVSTAPFIELLQEVDTAIQHIHDGTYGTCTVCHGTVERERLIADPLVRVCLDCLTTEERRALEGDLELASVVQRGLLPQKTTRFGDWHIHYEYKPAGMVSGDYCDLIMPRENDGKLVFLLGDVAGKGMAAALLMTHLHAMFRSLANPGDGSRAKGGMELEQLLGTANRVFCESTFAGQYATLICGRAGQSGEIEIASAGHLPAVMVTREGVKRIHATGLPLGMFATSPYTVQRVRLEPGDSLLLYTDGISEARNAKGAEYGLTRLSSVAGERHGWVPQELLAACMRDVAGHSSGAKQHDDQTLMVIHRTDAAGISLSE